MSKRYGKNQVMARPLAILVLVVLAATSPLWPGSRAIKDGDYALDFRATDLQGSQFDGGSLKGKIVLIDFWAVWCAPCIDAIPTLERLDSDLQDQGFEVIGIATHSGSATEVGQFAAEHQIDYTILVGDDEIVDQFALSGYPTYVLIAPDGTLHKRYVGSARNLYDEIRTQVTNLRGP